MHSFDDITALALEASAKQHLPQEVRDLLSLLDDNKDGQILSGGGVSKAAGGDVQTAQVLERPGGDPRPRCVRAGRTCTAISGDGTPLD